MTRRSPIELLLSPTPPPFSVSRLRYQNPCYFIQLTSPLPPLQSSIGSRAIPAARLYPEPKHLRLPAASCDIMSRTLWLVGAFPPRFLFFPLARPAP